MRSRLFLIIGLISAAGVAACDLTVTNAGPVPDSALDDSTASVAIVNGMGKSLSLALGYVAFTGAIDAKEIVASGGRLVAALGVSVKQRAGDLDPATEETDLHWRLAQQARWIAEDGIRRMRITLGDNFAKDPLAAQALVDAGFAERLLGENMCVGIIDGGAPESRDVYFTRAEAEFTEAMTIAGAAGNTDLAHAAQAGRASVRVWLNDWAGAESDARAIPDGFKWQALYSTQDATQYNHISAANDNPPTRSHSVVGTFYESYYTTTKDPRTPWSSDPAYPKGTTNVTWLFPTKYTTLDAPVNLVTSREMRLIIAESLLRSGDWQGAVALVNTLRADVGVAPWPASNVADAWTALARERGIELWLEGRRLGDLYRLLTEKVPGTIENMTGRDLCFPVGISEATTNPNIQP
jgi:hypothetical protein